MIMIDRMNHGYLGSGYLGSGYLGSGCLGSGYLGSFVKADIWAVFITNNDISSGFSFNYPVSIISLSDYNLSKFFIRSNIKRHH